MHFSARVLAYYGPLLYNRTSAKLKTPKRNNPPEQWVRSPDAFEGLVSLEVFIKAQELFESRRKRYEPAFMLEQLDALCREHGIFRTSLLRQNADLPSADAYKRQFGSLDLAFQQIHHERRDQARELVHERICQYVPEVLPYSDFLVLGRKLTVSIAPAVPIPHGYSAYWPIRPDERKIIDMTLGVLLSDTDATEILGYVALPRLLAGSRTLRFGSASMRTELFGRCDLTIALTTSGVQKPRSNQYCP